MRSKDFPRPEIGAGSQCIKRAFPFRLGTTSYILPAGIMSNLRYLQGRIDDVELVLFESDTLSNLPSPDEMEEMARLKEAGDLTYTVHLPLDIRLGSADEAERTASMGKCRRVIERMEAVQPLAWILHLHGDRRGDPPSDDLARWNAQNRRSLEELFSTGPAPQTICVETLDYDFALVEALVDEFNLSVCLDIGHLLVTRRNVAAHLDRCLDRTRVFHVHGVTSEGTDHVNLGHLPEGLLEDLADRLIRTPRANARVMTMEVFGVDDFERSMRTVAERLAQWQK